jgi:hypothetical protein
MVFYIVFFIQYIIKSYICVCNYYLFLGYHSILIVQNLLVHIVCKDKEEWKQYLYNGLHCLKCFWKVIVMK